MTGQDLAERRSRQASIVSIRRRSRPETSFSTPKAIPLCLDFPDAEKKENFSGELSNIEDLGVSAFPELKRIFTDKREKWKRRYASAISLSRLRYEESKKLLLSGLKDELSVIRVASILALKRFPHDDVIDGLHRVFKKDRGMIVRSAAANALGEIADPKSIPVLAAGLNDKKNFYKGRNLWIRKDIVNALGKFKSKEPVPCLIDILCKKDTELYEPAVRVA